jgi:hypothetical protein
MLAREPEAVSDISTTNIGSVFPQADAPERTMLGKKKPRIEWRFTGFAGEKLP